MFKVGQLAVNIDEGTTHQIRHIKIQNGEQMLGFGRKRFAWCFAKYYRKYKKVAVKVSRHKKYLKRAIADVESCMEVSSESN